MAVEIITGFNDGKLTDGGQLSKSPDLQEVAANVRIRYAKHMGGGREAFLVDQTNEGPIFFHVLFGENKRPQGVEYYSTVDGKPGSPQRLVNYEYEERQGVKHPLTQEVIPSVTVITVREYEIVNRKVSPRPSGIARVYEQSERGVDQELDSESFSLKIFPLWYEEYTFRESNYPSEKGKWIESARTYFFVGKCIEYIQSESSSVHRLDLAFDREPIENRGLPTLPEEIVLPPYLLDVHSFNYKGN